MSFKLDIFMVPFIFVTSTQIYIVKKVYYKQSLETNF